MAVGFYILYGFLWLFALLPLKVLFLLADFIYFILHYVIKYRKDVILKNLKNSFPEKSDKELKKIYKAFHKHLADVIVETLKGLHISKKFLKKHAFYTNHELLQEYYNKGKSVLVITAHYSNWEWSIPMAYLSDLKGLVIYKPLKNKRIDKLVRNNRLKLGGEAVKMKLTLKKLVESHRNNEKILWVSATDQRPLKKDECYWTNFLNQETGLIIGSEKIARKLNHAVVFMDMTKIKRGHYEVELIPITENAKDTKEFEISEKAIRLLEKKIIERPEYWLWSHKRWKHKRER
jgi:KDO2-lipid IV(A) lauroyltransferase